MGASRDFTSTALLERPYAPPAQTPLPKRRRPVPNRLGSRQVVSVRGRRVAELKKTSLLAKLFSISIVLAIAGVAVAMWLAGLATQQTFQMQLLQSQDKQLSNQLETLNRDLENVRSSAEIARRAGELGMVAPAQPGILAVQENGDILEQRPADPATRPIIDVNGAPVRPGQASSDPDAIDELGDNLEAVPQGHQLRSPDDILPDPVAPAPEPGVLPYAPNVPETAESTDN
ncbi:hypothetical protein SAMN06295981_0397 [Corynebacterium pollutisoli]|uniref:Cell division protein FtsL n=1 Tax=Corynebacterium pollutisoli TaxID=1610489 RepID=A0A1X7I5F7_9CORY|nr:hypothetical protein [Corynebacterium pollutisoli]NLP39040.1 hypothetical protein [Corynebacterium pollutisoli]SMG09086.1 hypothetical protein SAMN06295981_0397 [Corynebacterium pollutisoli]HJD77898.1 hypothetical protein [Corynebacterium pollutisoli]